MYKDYHKLSFRYVVAVRKFILKVETVIPEYVSSIFMCPPSLISLSVISKIESLYQPVHIHCDVVHHI